VKSIRDSVIRASDTLAALSERHEAFGHLVICFQDMAFAYSFAMLRDTYLAEDVAQEAFIVAWHKLPQLREPEAFPGWFKRIVATQCNRLLRTKRLQFVNSEAATEPEARYAALDKKTERRQLVDKVLREIGELPDKQRVVTTLFYVNGYTQDDISRFLDLPISTVNKRLYTARETLKGRMADLVRDDFAKHRPSRNNHFSNEVNTRLRPLSKNDWTSITRMALASFPHDPSGKELWLSRRQAFADSKYVRRQYVAEERRRILAYGAIEQSIYLPRYQLFLVASPAKLREGVGDLLLDQLLKDLEDAKAITVSCHERSSNAEVISLLTKRGFKEVNRQLDSRLSLAEAEVKLMSASENALDKTGITISTLTKERATDPKFAEKLHQLSVSLAEENGHLDFVPPAYDEREALMWLNMPYVLPDGYFIARHQDRYVGVADVNLHNCLPGGVSLGGPGVMTEHRGLGIGTALLLQTIEFAKASGYKSVRAFNRTSDDSLLQLLRKMKFESELEVVTLEKCLRPVVSIDDAQLYNGYAGTYVAERPQSQLNMEVRNENGRLTLECVGQKVQLFPTSETDFFIKMFYGEVSFVRTEGRVSQLDFSYRNGESLEEYKATKTGDINKLEGLL
jgi:RNA polymerase sigma factor (sigma-70 family)